MTTTEFTIVVVSTLAIIVIGGLFGLTVLALVDRYCQGESGGRWRRSD
jgi:hypothetical protein